MRTLRDVHDILLSPLSYADDEAWLREACRAYAEAVQADAGFVVMAPLADATNAFLGVDFPEAYLERLSALVAPAPGRMNTRDTAIETFLRNGRTGERGAVVCCADWAVDHRHLVEESPAFQEVALPSGRPGSCGLMVRGAFGEYLLNAIYPDIMHRPFGEDTTVRLSMLLPSLAAGLAITDRLMRARRALDTVLDLLTDAAVVFDADGRSVLARNDAALRLESDEPEWHALVAAVRAVAAGAAWPTRRPTGSPRPVAAASRQFATARVTYRLHAARLPAGSFSRTEAVVVLIRTETPVLPSAATLAHVFGLTNREADVALGLAIGHSNTTLAARLGISRHTVRHHSERVFVKLGVRTRKALALRLFNLRDGV